MAFRVIFHPRAQRDLDDIYDYVSDKSSPKVAADFVASIRNYCLGFSTFPLRGATRDDISPGVRIVGYRRRISIAFSVIGEAVWIVGLYYSGRNIKHFGWNIPDD